MISIDNIHDIKLLDYASGEYRDIDFEVEKIGGRTLVSYFNAPRTICMISFVFNEAGICLESNIMHKNLGRKRILHFGGGNIKNFVDMANKFFKSEHLKLQDDTV